MAKKKTKKKTEKVPEKELMDSMLDSIASIMEPMGINGISFCDENGKEESKIEFKKKKTKKNYK